MKLLHPDQHLSHMICPNWGKQNFVAVHITVTLFMKYYQKVSFLHTGDQHFTKVSFHYQILDFRNMALKTHMVPMFPSRQRVELGMQYMLAAHPFYDDRFPIQANSSESLVYVGKFPDTLIYSFTLYTANFLTPVISRANVTCNIPEAEAVFYDGPVQTFWQPVLPLLKQWSCSDILDRAKIHSDEDGVRGSVGELNVILFIPGVKTLESSYLTIAWHAERILPGILRFHEIVLDWTTVDTRTILFEPTRSTSVEVVHVIASQFVHLAIQEITYVAHSEMYSNRFFAHCLDGFEITDPMMPDVSGHICSNSTAQNLLNHYQTGGLTLGRRVILTKKQYAWLATMSAVITASSQSCAGYINVLPDRGNIFLRTMFPNAMASFQADREYFENGTFAGYQNVLINFKRRLEACCRLQLVPFDELVLYELQLKQWYSHLKYTITSEDLTSPARFITDLSSIGDALQFGNVSSSYGLRIYSLDNRFERHALAYTGVWDTEAYSAEIALYYSSLTHAAGLTVQVEDGRTLPVCTYEDGTNGTDLFFYDINLLGPCTYAELNSQEVRTVIIHKTYETRRCCHFDGYIATDYSTDGTIVLYLSMAVRYKPWTASYWRLSQDNTIIKFQVPCESVCLSIVIELTLDRIPLRTLSIAYHANLIEQAYATGITFPHLRSPLALTTPKSRLVTWNQVCHSHNCYITPRDHMPVTWDEAQEACKGQQANLVSINSDLEWALLTRLPHQGREELIELYNIHQFIFFYIGLVTDVSI